MKFSHDTKAKVKSNKLTSHQNIIRELQEKMTNEKKQALKLSQEKVASTWLTSIPSRDENYCLNKQQFHEQLPGLRYGWEIQRLPSTCPCGSKFGIDHTYINM